ncbi:MAG: hypothetical protein M0Q38_03930 [Bacteroidales bacterium]|jgi:hypothetical protein|nr:hypothetical protein [Bacteroidales bacterium]
MKKRPFVLLALALVLIGASVNAQDYKPGKNEITLGYGAFTGVEMANALFSIWPALGMTIGKDTLKDYNCSFYGLGDLEYLRWVNPWLRVGASLSVNPVSTLITTKSGRELTWNYYFITVMPRIDFVYFSKGIFSMYSGLQAGASLILWSDRQGSATINDSGLSAAFHLNAFGMRLGKEIGAYMEWGYGFRGTFNIGISGKF